MTEAPKTRLIWRLLHALVNLVVCVAILGGAAVGVWWINQTEPTAQKDAAKRKSSALVETTTVRRGTFAPSIVVLGTVQPAREITLSPQVSGQIIQIATEFVPGGMVREGESLLKIDPADFRNALAVSNSDLEKANASLEIELARQSLAEKELKLLEGTINETNRALVLREPQIATIRAEINAAKASIERATLNLNRTNIVAPFDAQVISRSVNVGSQVGTGAELARLVGIDEYWVMAAVPVRNLKWIRIPGMGSDTPSRVRLRDPDSWPDGAQRQGQITRMIGRLDEQTRLARVLISVKDPLSSQEGAPPLILNSLVETSIEGQPIENVVRLQRDYVRDSDTVWVMKDDKLQIRPTEVVFRDAKYAYLNSGLEDGDEVVVTTLATVAEGIGLRKIHPESDSDSTASSADDAASTGASAAAGAGR